MTDGIGGEVGTSGRRSDPGESRLPTVSLLGETFVLDTSSAAVLILMDWVLGGEGKNVIETG